MTRKPQKPFWEKNMECVLQPRLHVKAQTKTHLKFIHININHTISPAPEVNKILS